MKQTAVTALSVMCLAAHAEAKHNDHLKPMWEQRPELYEPLETGQLGASNEAPSGAKTLEEAHLRPKLKKFQQNIYKDTLYSESALYDYINAFYVGFQFDKYNFGEECFTESRDSLDTLYSFNIEMIRRYTWADPFLYTSQQVAKPINDAWFHCWQFKVDFMDSFWEKKNNFVDLPDFYLSFIFNLLGNSFQIKSSSEAMITASQTHDSVTFYQQLGALLQIMYDFESYKTTASALESFMQHVSMPSDEVKGVAPKHVRAARRVQSTPEERAEQKRLRELNPPEPKKLKDGEGYNWPIKGFLFSPLALMLGSLNALGGDSSASYCSRYTLSSRQLIYDAQPYFEDENPLDGYATYHESFAYADNIAHACYNAFSTEISTQHFKDLFKNWYNIPVNLLYNFGFMWVDLVNYYFYNPETVPQGDWAFFFFYQVGDFFMRFIYNSSDAED